MHYKASKNDSVLGPMPHDPIYSGISCFSLYCKAQSLCLLPTANFGLLKILQDGSYLSQSYTWYVCNLAWIKWHFLIQTGPFQRGSLLPSLLRKPFSA